MSFVGLGGPLCTRAEKPPMKLTPVDLAALSMATAKGTKLPVSRRPGHKSHGGDGDAFVDDGDAELPLNGLAEATRCSARRVILS